jgi:hypothetical protein
MKRACAVAVCAVGLCAPAGALAAGGPVPAVQGPPGISALGSHIRYVTIGAGHNTIVQRVDSVSGAALRSLRIAGSFGVPGAAYDGSTTGLSADGGTLVLAQVTGVQPTRRTQLVVLDSQPLRLRGRIALRGYYTVDAISPSGRWLYLIHYTNVAANHYEVRAYDLTTRRLLPDPIVDPRDRGEKMEGVPVTRRVSPDGRWAYTLYAGQSPFIHMLDTKRLTAVCVDLPRWAFANLGATQLVLSRDGNALEIQSNGVTSAVVDARTFVVRRPAPVAIARSPVRPVRHRSGGPWAFVLAAAAVLAAAVALAAAGIVSAKRRRRIRSTQPTSHQPLGASPSPGAAGTAGAGLVGRRLSRGTRR